MIVLNRYCMDQFPNYYILPVAPATRRQRTTFYYLAGRVPGNVAKYWLHHKKADKMGRKSIKRNAARIKPQTTIITGLAMTSNR